MMHRPPAILIGLTSALLALPAPAADFCNIVGTNQKGVEFVLAMNGAQHVAGSDFTPSALMLKGGKNGEAKDYSARHCIVHFFDAKARMYLERMHIRCSAQGTPLQNIHYKYDPWKQSFVCRQGCSKDAPRMLEFEICG